MLKPILLVLLLNLLFHKLYMIKKKQKQNIIMLPSKYVLSLTTSQTLHCFHSLSHHTHEGLEEAFITSLIASHYSSIRASLRAQLVKNLPAMWETWFNPGVGRILWRRERLTTPVFWPGGFHGLYSCIVHGVRKTERLSLSLSHVLT